MSPAKSLKSICSLLTAICLAGLGSSFPADGFAQTNILSSLEVGWNNPPRPARLRAYWWWLNGNVTKASITHDLEEMKLKGFGGAVLIDAGGASQDGNGQVPHGPTFFSTAWRELFKHTLREANRLGLEMSLNIQSGWNLGGPGVTRENAAKKYVWSEMKCTGGTNLRVQLPAPTARENFYRDTAIIAYRVQSAANHRPLRNWKQKALQQSLEPFSSPDSSALFAEFPAESGERDADVGGVINLTGMVDTNGLLRWAAPSGDWQIFRFGYTIGDHAYVSTCSEGWSGFALDVYSATAFQYYWNAVVEPLIADAGALAGTTLKYLHTDSWEIELANWTPTLPTEFRKRHGYDLTPWLPVLAGRIMNSRAESDRFLFDYRQTLGDLAIDNHYRLFRDNAHKHGLEIHPESGGPHAVPIDAQRCLGWDDVPMSEFWAWSWTHRIGDANRFFVKQPASAAHTYGRRISQDEGFTTIGPHWQSRLWNNLKPAFDQALCEGMNRLVWHAFVCSPDETGVPGQQYFAGTHLNPKVTWWDDSAPFFGYINRCQFMLQQGLFVADVCYYYGDHVPNFAQLKASDPAHILPGYDYDVITAEALIERASVKDGRIVLPDGMSYRVLVLPDRDTISLAVLEKIQALVTAGATVIGPKPERGETLENFAATDAAVRKIADDLWGGKTGRGRVITGKTAREVLLADGVPPDCKWSFGLLPAAEPINTVEQAGSEPETRLNLGYIHRTADGAEIYFLANRSTNAVEVECTFRVAGKAPEIWNPVSGEHHFASTYTQTNGCTTQLLEFAPCGSTFVVFRKPASEHPATAANDDLKVSVCGTISGPWTVHFDSQWGGPATATFAELVDWTSRPEPGIKYFSGSAVYEKTFDLPQSVTGNRQPAIFLDLGDVRELADVRLNGKDLGILWTPPFRVNLSKTVRATGNHLEIKVVNFWPNRIIGDAGLPPTERLTRTNIRELTSKTSLMPSGLLGPIRLFVGP
jgi:hypothetical protein